MPTSHCTVRVASIIVVLALAGPAALRQQTGPPPLSAEIPALPPIDQALPTLFLVGDSTVKVGTSGQMGWGEVVGEYFDRARLNVVNYARGGRSSRTPRRHSPAIGPTPARSRGTSLRRPVLSSSISTTSSPSATRRSDPTRSTRYFRATTRTRTRRAPTWLVRRAVDAWRPPPHLKNRNSRGQF